MSNGNGTLPTHHDVIIIGAGTSGLAALREVSKKTGNVLLVNDGPYGTTCARVGCMPSKAFIEAAEAFHDRHKFDTFGIRGGDALSIDIPAVLRHVRKLRDRFVSGTLKATEDLGERSLAGRARFTGPQSIDVDGQTFTADRIIIAAGSRPVVPGPWRDLGERIMTTDTLFEQQDLPARIAVIGLGPVGIEMAQALAHLGLEVTGFDRSALLAGLTDEKVEAALRAVLEEQLTVHSNTDVELAATDDGVIVRADGIDVEVDRVLVSVGRRPNIDTLDLDALGVDLDENGMPPFDPETTQVADLPVFMAGDINHHAPILHEAADEGYIAGVNAVADRPSCFRRRTPLGVVFSEPAVAFIGQRYAALKDQNIAIGEVNFGNQGRAVTAQRNYGLMRLYASREDACLLGAEICVPAADHMAHLLALAIGQNLTVHDLLRMPFYHPVLEEGLRSGLRDMARQFDFRKSDLAACGDFEIEALD